MIAGSCGWGEVSRRPAIRRSSHKGARREAGHENKDNYSEC